MNEKADEKEASASDDTARYTDKKSTSDNNKIPKTGLIIVGIGASAGGLTALQKVLPGLPANSDLAYVIVQHLAPRRRSLLPSLLAKHSSMPVETINNGMRVQPNTIYITPPNKDVKLSANRLKLSVASSIGPKPSIDYFFDSLADQKKSHAVGIILSGTGSDGAHGIRAIKSNEGITMAQSADSAKFPGMPQSAVNTGHVDLVLPPEKIGQELASALKYPHLMAKQPNLDAHADEISIILEMLHKNTGVGFSDYKPATIHRRISRRMVIHKVQDLRHYVELTRQDPQELTVLYKDLLISVTRFFRDPEAFEALARDLRLLLKNKKPGDSFRAWVPGCSTGEEVYSIAILVAEILGGDLAKYRIQLFATDIDEDSVQLARKGVYPVATVMDTDGRHFEKYFTHSDNTVTVKKHIRDMVVLARQNLIKDTPFLHLDLISCRNLLIYINAELQNKLLSLFHFSLSPNGLLFLGKSESVNQRMDLFKPVDNRWKIYRRRETAAKRLPKLMQNRHMTQLASHREKRSRQHDSGRRKDREFADSLLGLMDSCAVQTDEQGNILYIRGDLSPYFKLPEGSVRESLNAIEMARPEVRFVLQSMLHKSIKENRVVTNSGITLDGNDNGVQVKIGPVKKKNAEGQRLIMLTPVEVPKPAPRSGPSAQQDGNQRIVELEQELEGTREHLQDTIEELETSTEELQSLNEELQSANEELQASNEELETSNEELQASNEELNTVNDELRSKSEEAAELLEELKSSEKRYRLLVDNMNEALMLCKLEYGRQNRPTDLIIKQTNRALEQLMAIERHELPLRAGSVRLREMVDGQMLERFDQVAKGGRPQRFELHLSELGIDLTLSVYSLKEGRVGVVCRNDTERKKSEAALAASEQKAKDQLAELEAIYRSAPIGLCILDEKQRFVRLNERLAEINGMPVSAHIGRTVRQVVPDLADQAEALHQKVMQAGKPVFNVEISGKTSSQPGAQRTWIEQWLPIKNDSGRVVAINVVSQEITERKTMETELEQSRNKLDRLVKQRTAELEATVEALRREAAERQKTENKLRQLSKVFMDSSDPIIIEDLNKRIADANKAAEKTYGYTRGELIGQPVKKLIDPQRRLQADELRERCLNGETVRNWEGKRCDKKGICHDVLVTAFALKEDNDKPVAIATIAKDISKIKAMQQEMENRANQLARLTNELTLAEQRERHRLARLLHDHLQQLLAGAKMKLEGLADEGAAKDHPDLQGALEMVVESLKTSRSLSAELSPPVLYQQGFEQALQWLARWMHKTHGLKVELDLDKAAAPEKEEIKILLFESVRELLFNVVKHAGTKTARVEMHCRDERTRIVVSDGGTGFDPQKFCCGHMEAETGYGLFNIRERLLLIGGSFDIDSDTGSGTAVTMTAPLHASICKKHFEKEPPVVQTQTAPAPLHQANRSSDGKIRVMLVDDHAVMRNGLSAMLARQADIEVAGEAADGEEAVVLAREIHPDVILMDINMPKMDGVQATRLISAELPGIRIIALSMYEVEDQAAVMLEAGAAGYLNKAGSSDELLTAIRKQ